MITYVDKSLDADGPWTLTQWTPAPQQQIAICDRCAIMLGHPMAVKNATGRTITVGADCAEALIRCDVDVARQSRELARLTSAVRAHNKSVRDARNDRKRDELTALMGDSEKVAALKSKPHPIQSRAAKGDTLYDWADWMLAHSGATGRYRDGFGFFSYQSLAGAATAYWFGSYTAIA